MKQNAGIDGIRDSLKLLHFLMTNLTEDLHRKHGRTDYDREYSSDESSIFGKI